MKTRNAAIAAALILASLQGTADAGVVIDVSQVGSDVVATGSGSLDLTGLSLTVTVPLSTTLDPIGGVIIIGPSPGGSFDGYSGFQGPSSFGPGGQTFPSEGTGDLMGVDNFDGNIQVPAGYVSGTPLAGSSTFDNTTIAGLGLTPGTYTYTWSSDSLTVVVASVPEPSSLAMAGMAAAAGLIAARRRRSRPDEERAW